MLLDLTACYIIPAYTLLFAGSNQWFTTNFSVLGSRVEVWPFFVLWAIIIGLYLRHCLHALIPAMEGPQWLWRVKSLTLILLIFGVTTPYVPESYPIRAALHTVFGVGCALSILLILLVLLHGIWKHNPTLAMPYLLAMFGITLITLFLLAIAGIISSALEVFLVISNSILLRKMVRQQWQ